MGLISRSIVNNNINMNMKLKSKFSMIIILFLTGNSTESDEKIKNGEVDIIFASPETLVGDPIWRTIFQQLAVGVIVIDEFHTITTW